MAWAIVTLVDMNVGMWISGGVDDFGNPLPNVWEEIDIVPGTIINIISYDGSSPYTPPENTKLEEVPDSAKIGDTGY